jgi:hypothetical protein
MHDKQETKADTGPFTPLEVKGFWRQSNRVAGWKAAANCMVIPYTAIPTR